MNQQTTITTSQQERWIQLLKEKMLEAKTECVPGPLGDGWREEYGDLKGILGVVRRLPTVYDNADRLCDCDKCEMHNDPGGDRATYCPVRDKFQRHPRDLSPGSLGECPKLKGG